MWMMLSILAGCSPDDPAPPDEAEPADPPDTVGGYGVEQDFATTSRCDVDGDTIAAVYDGEQAVLVHGDTERDAELAAEVAGYYDPVFGVPLILRAASDLTDADRQHHLMVMGGSDTNPLLAELNGALPVWFDPGVFTVAGYRWPDHGHGVALIHPSPYNPDRYVVLYAGNTLDGAWATFTVPTGNDSINLVRGRGELMIEGTLCADGARWEVSQDDLADWRDDWDAFVADLVVREGRYHRLLVYPGSNGEDELDDIEATQESAHEAALAWLEIDPLDAPIATYVYPTRDDKEDVTGIDGNAHANDLNLEVHLLYSPAVSALGSHEDVHVLAWHRIGDAGTTLLGEGLAVAVGGSWLGTDLEQWATEQLAAGTLPAVRDLIDDFWGAGGGSDAGYGASGALVEYLRDTHGIEAVKAIYVASDVDGAFEDVLGLTTAEVEVAWHATLGG